jgi:two-component system, LuxR family, response regulator FixJ
VNSINASGVVHIVDDDAAVRRSLERLLGSAGLKTRAYDSAESFLASRSQMDEGCVLLDIRMPGMDGLDLQIRLNELHFELPVIIMTGHGEVQIAVRAMKAGAVDFVEKPFDDEYLLSAIGRALGRKKRAAWDQEIDDLIKQVSGLSPREREVLEHLIAGRSTKAIAHSLGLSVRTIEVHRARMMERLGVRSLAEAIRIAVTAQLGRRTRGS